MSRRTLLCAMVLLSVVGCVGSPPSASPAASNSGVPSTETTASPPTPSASPCVDELRNEAPLVAGCTYQSVGFVPHVRFVADSSWTALLDIRDQVALAYGNQQDGLGMSLIDVENLFATACDAKAITNSSAVYVTTPWKESAAGKGPQEFFAWLARQRPLVMSEPHAVVIAGQPGLETTVSAPADSLAACGHWLMITDTKSPGGALGIPEKASIRIDALDAGGQTILVWVFAPDAAKIGVISGASDSLLSTLTFP